MLTTLRFDGRHTIPTNNRNTEEGSNATKQKCHNTPWCEACWKLARRFVRPREIKEIDSVASRIPSSRRVRVLAYLEVIGGNAAAELLLKSKRIFDHGRNKTGRNMPLDMTVEQPDPWVISAEAEDEVAVWTDKQSVSAHRSGRHRRCCTSVVGAGFVVRA